MTTLDAKLERLRISREAVPAGAKRRRLRVRYLLLAICCAVLAVLLARYLQVTLERAASSRQSQKQMFAGQSDAQLTKGQTITAAGYVVPERAVEVGARVVGRIISLSVTEGSVVHKGQVIAVLDDRELRAQLHQAEASLAAAEARLQELASGHGPSAPVWSETANGRA